MYHELSLVILIMYCNFCNPKFCSESVVSDIVKIKLPVKQKKQNRAFWFLMSLKDSLTMVWLPQKTNTSLQQISHGDGEGLDSRMSKISGRATPAQRLRMIRNQNHRKPELKLIDFV